MALALVSDIISPSMLMEKMMTTAKELELLRKDAENGSVISQYLLGRAYLLGEGVKKNHKQAKVWLTKARDQGSEDAQRLLNVLARANMTYTLRNNPNKSFCFRRDDDEE